MELKELFTSGLQIMITENVKRYNVNRLTILAIPTTKLTHGHSMSKTNHPHVKLTELSLQRSTF